MKFTFLLLFLFVNISQIHAQFSDSLTHKIRLSTAGTLNKTSEGMTYLLNNSGNFSVKKKQFVMNSNASWLYGGTLETMTNNDVNASVDFNVYNKKVPDFYYWGLVNFTSSFSLKINEQVQTGLGVAYRVVNKDNIMFSISDGLLYERSNIIQPDSMEFQYRTIRNSLRLQLNWKHKDFITVTGSGFWQPSLTYRNDHIVTTNLNVGFKVWRWITLNTALNYNLISRTEKENFILTYGIVFERFF
ncbi:MAG TPA: DUF481 domain-containing protein [Dyadobacter sp.]|jgi:hypothetical protein|nr:DUF481 domain-containing protein [Dyadobacter sp.]